MIVEAIKLVGTTGITYYIPALSLQKNLDPGPVEDDQHALDGIASNQDSSERADHHSGGICGKILDGKTKLRLYITGEAIVQSKFLFLNIAILRPRTSMCNKWIHLFVLQHDQNLHCKTCRREGEGCVARTGLAWDMEAEFVP